MGRDLLHRLMGDAGQYWELFISRLGATTVEIGLIRSISSAMNMLLAVPSGWLTDRTPRMKRLYLVGRVLYFPTMLMRFLATTWPFCLLINVWETICMRVLGPASQILFIGSLGNEDRVKGLSLHRTITSVAGILSPMIVAFVISSFGGLESADSIRPLFLLQFVVWICTSILLLIQLQEVTFKRQRREIGFLSHFFGLFKEVPVLRLLLLRQCVMMFINQLRMPFNSIYLVDVKGADEFILGWQGTVSTALMVCLSIPVGHITERFGRRRVAYFSRVCRWVSYVITILTPLTHPEYLIIASFFDGLFMTLFVGWQAFDQELVPLESRGRFSGVTMLLNGLIGVIAPILGGVIWQIHPDYIWWICLLGDAFLSLPLMIMIGRKFSKTEAS
jgi:MFS family permease